MNHLRQWSADVTKGLQDMLWLALSFMADLHGAFCPLLVAPLLLRPPRLYTPVWINLAKLAFTALVTSPHTDTLGTSHYFSLLQAFILSYHLQTCWFYFLCTFEMILFLFMLFALTLN